MKINDTNFDPSQIDASERSPLVSMLLSVIESLTNQLQQQAEQLAKQSEKIDLLLNEIRHLKNLPKKPKVRASSLAKDRDDKDNEPPTNTDSNDKPKRPGSAKRSKNKALKIDKKATRMNKQR